MRDEHDRQPLLGAEVGQPQLQFGAGEVVERAERFVEQQHRTVLHDRTQQCDPLTHAA